MTMVWVAGLGLLGLIVLGQIGMVVTERLVPDCPPASPLRQGAIEIGIAVGFFLLMSGSLLAVCALLYSFFEIFRRAIFGI